MNILGISGQERDAAAALVQEGKLIAAIEEEKLARIRHVGMDYAGGLPERAINFCLERAGLKFSDVHLVAYYLEPHKMFHREVAFNSARATRQLEASSIDDFPPYFIDSLNELKQRLRTQRLIQERLSERGRFVAVNHHLAHGAGAFFASGFDRAAVISAGNRGDMNSTALLVGSGADLELGAEAQYPNSIGLLYNAVTEALGFSNSDSHKTMWLAPTGKPRLLEIFQDILRVGDDGLPVLNVTYFGESFRPGPSLAGKFFELIGINPRARDEAITSKHRDVAASVQLHIENVMCEIAIRHRAATGEDSLCLTGGVALNSFVNSAIEKRAGFKRLFVQPAAGNAGCSVGAALYAWHKVLGNSDRSYKMNHAFLGPQFDDDSIKSVLDNCKLAYEYFLTEDKFVAEVARQLADSKIVGWFRGAMEFGPRTLGARSILASPLSEMMRENLNVYIKHREDFRPFSASVPEESASDYFEPSVLSDFLQGVDRIKPGKETVIPAAVFGNGLVRVHTVSRKTNPSFWKLLTRLGDLTGVPVLLNTSFNLFGEPVVSTPREAVRGFFCSGIDCLAIGNFVVKK